MQVPSDSLCDATGSTITTGCQYFTVQKSIQIMYQNWKLSYNIHLQ